MSLTSLTIGEKKGEWEKMKKNEQILNNIKQAIALSDMLSALPENAMLGKETVSQVGELLTGILVDAKNLLETE